MKKGKNNNVVKMAFMAGVRGDHDWLKKQNESRALDTEILNTETEKEMKMKKIEKMLNDYKKTAEEIETLKTDRSALIQAAASGKTAAKEISKIKDLDIRTEIANVTLGNIRQLIIDQVRPEALENKAKLEKQFDDLLKQRDADLKDFLKALADAIAKNERLSHIGTRSEYVNGKIVEYQTPDFNFSAQSLDDVDRQFYATAIQNARKKFASGPALDEQMADLHREMEQVEKILKSDPAEYTDKLLEKGRN